MWRYIVIPVITAWLAIAVVLIVSLTTHNAATRVTMEYHGYPVTCTQTVDQSGNGWLNNCSYGR